MPEPEPGSTDRLTVNTEHPTISYDFGPQFTNVQPLAHGATGLVFSARDEERKRDVAIKTLGITRGQSGQQTLREIKILSRLKHENVVEVLDIVVHRGSGGGSYFDLSQVLVIQELLDTDLHSIIVSKQLREDHIVFFTYQLLRGLKYIHSLNVIHRDLKPSNILIGCDSLQLKITDFGISRVLDPQYCHKGQLSPYAGSCWYHAPEQLLSPRSYDTGVDVWAAGCVVVEMMANMRLFSASSPLEQLRQLLDVVFLSESDWSRVLRIMPNKMLKNHPFKPRRTIGSILGDTAQPTAIDLVERLLTFDPSQRPQASAALAHPYLRCYHQAGDEPHVLEPLHIEHEVDCELSPRTLCQLISAECRLNPTPTSSSTPMPPPPMDHAPQPFTGDLTDSIISSSSSSSSSALTTPPSISPPPPEDMHTLDEILSLQDIGTDQIELEDEDSNSSSSSSHRSSSVEDLNLRNLRNSHENLLSASSYNILQLGVGEMEEEECKESKEREKESRQYEEKDVDEKDVPELSAEKVEEDRELERVIQSLIDRHTNELQTNDHQQCRGVSGTPSQGQSPGIVGSQGQVPGSIGSQGQVPGSIGSQSQSQGPGKQSQGFGSQDRLRVCIEHKRHETLSLTHTPPRARSPSCNHCIYISDDEEFKEKKLLEMDSASGGGTMSKVNADNLQSEKNDPHDLDELYRLPTEHLRRDDNIRDYSNQRLKHKHLSKIHVRQLLRYRDEINELNRLREDGACGGYEEEEADEVLSDGIVLTTTATTRAMTSPVAGLYTDRLTIQLNEQSLLTTRPRATDGFSSPEEQPSSPRQQQQQQPNAGARPKKSPRKQKAL